MNTVQNNVGRGFHATTSEQTALNNTQTAQIPLTPDDWQTTFLLEVATNSVKRDALFRLLDLGLAYYEAYDPVPGVCMLLNYYLREVATISPDERRELRAAIRLIGFLSSLRSVYECFEIATDYNEKAIAGEEEVSHE